jgi:hypothetical protein
VQLSAVIIAKDEAAHIAELAASLDGVVDEVVLLDTGSTDDTVALAQAQGFRVFHRPWTDHFADARNAALDHARGAWVLWLDADERIVLHHPVALRELVAALERTPGGDQADGFWIVLDSFVSDDHDPDLTERTRQSRLFRRSRFHFEGRIHEQLKLADRDATPLFLHAPPTLAIQHLGYAPAIWQRKHKAERNKALAHAALADPAAAVGAQSGAFRRYEVARAELLDSPATGLALLIDCLDDLPQPSDAHRHGTALAARTLLDRAAPEQALELLAGTDAAGSSYAVELWVLEATALLGAGRVDEAAALITKVESEPADTGSNLDRLMRLPALNVELLAAQGKIERAWHELSLIRTRGRKRSLHELTRVVADAAWRRATQGDRPDAYLAEFSAELDDIEFAKAVAMLPEWHQRAAAGVRHVMLHGAMIEPDPRLGQFLPRLAGYSVAAVLELAAARLDTEPALSRGLADAIQERADATAAERLCARVLRIKALLLLNHVSAAVRLAVALDAPPSAPDQALVAALATMSADLLAASVGATRSFEPVPPVAASAHRRPVR